MLRRIVLLLTRLLAITGARVLGIAGALATLAHDILALDTLVLADRARTAEMAAEVTRWLSHRSSSHVAH